MRQRAVDLGYTLKTWIIPFKNKKKLTKYLNHLKQKKISLLGMAYKEPTERLNTDAVVFLENKKSSYWRKKTHNKTIKKRKLKKTYIKKHQSFQNL